MWNDLLTTAMIGTERRALNLDHLPDSFKEIAAQLEGQDSEKILLALAGALTLHRRVGQMPQIDATPAPDPCDLDDLPPCSPRAGLLLGQILALSQYKGLLEEWTTLAAYRGQRVGEEYLPRLLTTLQRAALPEHFYDVLGKRGRWLAQQNEGWAYALLPQNDAEWENATDYARLEYVRRLRLSDPAHGLALIEAVWKHEKGMIRVQMLDLLEIGLNLGDEPFLEAMLGNYSTGFHYRAEWDLAKLPDSAFSQRMSARAEKYIRISRQKKKLIIDVTPPETWDESMGHDGIEENSSEKGAFDLHTYWLFCIVQKLSSAYWLGGDWTAEELAQAASEHPDWRKMLVGGMSKTAERENNDVLARALLKIDLDVQDETLALSGASLATREAFVLRVLEQDLKTGRYESFKLLRRLDQFAFYWSRPLTRAFISTIAQMLPKMSVPDLAGLSNSLPAYVMRMSPDTVEDLQRLATVENKNKATWSRAVKQGVSTLEFRLAMHKEFSR